MASTHYKLLDYVKAAYRNKRCRQSIRSVLLLHDNARSHTAVITRDKFSQIYWTSLEHLPYSSDLSLCDFLWALKRGVRRGAIRRRRSVTVRAQLTHEPLCYFYQGRDQEAYYTVEEMHFYGKKLCREIVYCFCNFICYQ